MPQTGSAGRAGYQVVKEKLEGRMAPVLGQACTALLQWLASPAADIKPDYRARLAESDPVPAAPPAARPKPPVSGITGYGLTHPTDGNIIWIDGVAYTKE